jgi:hypothetical protein
MTADKTKIVLFPSFFKRKNHMIGVAHRKTDKKVNFRPFASFYFSQLSNNILHKSATR